MTLRKWFSRREFIRKHSVILHAQCCSQRRKNQGEFSKSCRKKESRQAKILHSCWVICCCSFVYCFILLENRLQSLLCLLCVSKTFFQFAVTRQKGPRILIFFSCLKWQDSANGCMLAFTWLYLFLDIKYFHMTSSCYKRCTTATSAVT